MPLDHVVASVHAAFDPEPPPPADELFAPAFREAVDAGELRDVLAGVPWAEVAPRGLFLNREMLAGLSGVAYRGYIAAFMLASLRDDLSYAGDILEYTLLSMRERATLPELSAAQRAAIAGWIAHVAETRAEPLAVEIAPRCATARPSSSP